MRFVFLLVLMSFHVAFGCDTDVTILQGNTIALCHGSNTPVTASPGYESYTWSGPQSATGVTIYPNISGTYTVEATDSEGCVSSASIDVTVYPAPFGVINSSEGTVLCPGASTILSLTSGFTSYTWSTGSTQPLVFISSPGVYSVTVVDANGCSSSTSILISAPNFQVTASDTLICSGESVVIQATGGSSYNWSTGQISSSVAVTPDTTTTYSVLISQPGCSATLERTIYVVQLPDFLVQDEYLIAAGDVVFMNGPAGYENYSWQPQTSITLSNTQGTTFYGAESSVYVLHSSHSAGCTRTDTFTVVVLKPNVPNVFSPNNDGLNDSFFIPELETYEGKLIVWNRWGDIVFEAENYKNNWYGTCQSSKCMGNGPLPEGTYFYQLEIEQLMFTGFTTIMR